MKWGKRLSPRTSICAGDMPRAAKNFRSGRAVLSIHVALSRIWILAPRSLASAIRISAITSSSDGDPVSDTFGYAAQSASNASCAMRTERSARRNDSNSRP